MDKIHKNVCSKNLLVGSLLGDLNLQYTGRGFRIRILQHFKHEDWVYFLSKNLGYNGSDVLYDKYNRAYFNTFSSSHLNEIGFLFYPYATVIKSGPKKVLMKLKSG